MAERIEEWRVPHDHPALPGHFPGRPIVPGVLILDSVIQMACRANPSGLRLDSVKFVSPVGPDELLRLELRQKSTGSIQFHVFSGQRQVAVGSITEIPE